MCSSVQNLSGDEVCSLSGITDDTTVAELKAIIEELTGFSSSMMMLGINGKVTRDDHRVASYGWAPGGVIKAMKLQAKDAISICDSAMQHANMVDAGLEFRQMSYGYLQIDNYAKKKHVEKATGAKAGPTRWVSLPRDVEVLNYPSPGAACKRNISAPVGCEAPCSSLRKKCKQDQVGDPCFPFMCSVGSQSTLAATSEQRRYVHFVDGSVPSSDCEDLSPGNLDGYGISPLAEWVYIDRDICGYSLYEYSPDDAEFRDFGSSHWGRLFKKELSQLQLQSWRHHKAAMAYESYKEKYAQEEIELDLRLVDAGVSEQALQ